MAYFISSTGGGLLGLLAEHPIVLLLVWLKGDGEDWKVQKHSGAFNMAPS